MSSVSTADPRLILADGQVRELAAQYGTPLYVLDEKHLRERAKRYQQAFQSAWPKTALSFACKANSTLAVLKTLAEEGLHIDVASEGELHAAIRAGVDPRNCDLHGNAKKPREIAFAVEQGVRHIVVDCFEEIELLKPHKGQIRALMIRLAPGVDPKTHSKISTGQADTKFGFNIADGSAEKALTLLLQEGFPVHGFHCHVGSQLTDPEAQISGGQILADFAVQMRDKHGFEAQEINVGGGLGIHYTDKDQPLDVETYNKLLVEAIGAPLKQAGLNPTLAQEPGRWMVGESGVTIYEVAVVKTVPVKEGQTRTYVAVDGGLSDNPRPVMYGSQYTVKGHYQNPRETAPLTKHTVSGKHCETDKLFEDVELPNDIRRGDYVQVLCTGAYNSTMASNYNRYPRPATAWIRPDGSTTLVQRAENWDEMFAREILP